MLTPVTVVQAAMQTYSSLPPEGIAEVALEALAEGGYVVVPTQYLTELIRSNAAAALESM
jgi:hypothetical protein